MYSSTMEFWQVSSLFLSFLYFFKVKCFKILTYDVEWVHSNEFVTELQ